MRLGLQATPSPITYLLQFPAIVVDFFYEAIENFDVELTEPVLHIQFLLAVVLCSWLWSQCTTYTEWEFSNINIFILNKEENINSKPTYCLYGNT